MFKLHGRTFTTLKGAKISARAWLKKMPNGHYGLNTWCDIAEYKNGKIEQWIRIYK